MSRVGGDAQTKAVKNVASGLKLALAQFRELAAFAQFSTDLDAETKHRMTRGQLLTELLKQPQYSPMSIWEQVAILLAATEGAFDGVPIDKVKPAQHALLAQLRAEHKAKMNELDKGAKPSDVLRELILSEAKKIAKGYSA